VKQSAKQLIQSCLNLPQKLLFVNILSGHFVSYFYIMANIADGVAFWAALGRIGFNAATQAAIMENGFATIEDLAITDKKLLNSLDTKNPYPYAMQVTENNGSTSFSFIL
jgi:hypothetical protein